MSLVPELNRNLAVKLRQAILWQPDQIGRIGVFCVSTVLILFFSYLHVITGQTYEFYVFFAPPVALVAWYAGLRAGLVTTLLVVGLWFWTDRLLENTPPEFLPMVFNSTGRLLVLSASTWLLVRLHRVLERERSLAREDALTHLPNRREFHERGRQALAQAQREGTPITAVFLDLDKFKQVNDEHGHPTGDALLVCVASELSARLRISDIAGRLGGDEFALLLPGMGGSAARIYIEDLQQRLLQAMEIRQWPVTFSIGIASYAQAPSDLDAFLALADGLMYDVKNTGRNRILQRELNGS